jgi:hypothetical protein
MIIYPYKVRLYKKHPRKAHIEDDEGIRYVKLEPHPDGDPWMTQEGVEITLDALNIPRAKEWRETDEYFELQLNIIIKLGE